MNGDGDIDGLDFAILDCIESESENTPHVSGCSCQGGCLTWIFIFLILFQIFKWIAEAIY